jgi:chemotaxis protein MotB
MPLARSRARRSSIDIWPGFVDALAQLLMVIIFILLVFTAGQFLLSDALSGRDKALKELQQQLSELSDLLSLERAANVDLRASAASLSVQLQTALAERDTTDPTTAALEVLQHFAIGELPRFIELTHAPGLSEDLDDRGPGSNDDFSSRFS